MDAVYETTEGDAASDMQPQVGSSINIVHSDDNASMRTMAEDVVDDDVIFEPCYSRSNGVRSSSSSSAIYSNGNGCGCIGSTEERPIAAVVQHVEAPVVVAVPAAAEEGPVAAVVQQVEAPVLVAVQPIQPAPAQPLNSGRPLCAICLDDLLRNHPMMLPCHHVFCRDCVNELYEQDNTRCPLCREYMYSYADAEEIFIP
ncbi:E3 ubiquitin-protein ligase TRIM33-like [Contarinia nasturtii]|uniref:E3 ubiquitin-protein ligase TRIM33-like n=1 Tax=Contarinia nasturtii TaxID=265458 RepID=UPI0012D43638|nr:E3 ubiquitin-protein ligase TRIM33-like [Contarinia nasturtii]